MKVRVATPFRAAKAWVTRIDISAIKEEVSQDGKKKRGMKIYSGQRYIAIAWNWETSTETGVEEEAENLSPSHDSNLRRIHAASHTEHGGKQSSPLVESLDRGIESEIRPGPKTVHEGPPLATTRRGRSLPALPSVSRATALITKGDQNHEGPCLVRTSQSNRVSLRGVAIQDGDVKTSREGHAGNDGDGTDALAKVIETLFSPQKDAAHERPRETAHTTE